MIIITKIKGYTFEILEAKHLGQWPLYQKMFFCLKLIKHDLFSRLSRVQNILNFFDILKNEVATLFLSWEVEVKMASWLKLWKAKTRQPEVVQG